MAKALGTGGNSPSLASSSPAAELQPRTVSVRLDPQRLAVLERMREADSQGPTLSDIIRNMLDERLTSAGSPARPGQPTVNPSGATVSYRRPEKIVTDHFERNGAAWADVEPSVVDHFEALLVRQGYSAALQSALRQEFERSTDVVLAQTRRGLSELAPIALTFGSHSDTFACDSTARHRLDLNALLVEPQYRPRVAELGLMEAIANGVAPGTQLRANCRAVGIRPALAGMLRASFSQEANWTPEERERLPFVREWLVAARYPTLDEFLEKCEAQDSEDILRTAREYIKTEDGRNWLIRTCDPSAMAAMVEPRSEEQGTTIGALVAAFATSAWRPSPTGGLPRALCGPTHFHGRQGADPCLEVIFSNQSSDAVSLGARVRYSYAMTSRERAVAALQYEFRRSYAAIDLTASQHQLQESEIKGKLPDKPQESLLWRLLRVVRQPGEQSTVDWPNQDALPTPG